MLFGKYFFNFHFTSSHSAGNTCLDVIVGYETGCSNVFVQILNNLSYVSCGFALGGNKQSVFVQVVG